MTNVFYWQGKQVSLSDPQNHFPSNVLYNITMHLLLQGKDMEVPFNQSLMLIHLN